ncbi:MAG: transketolase C-terminal domain-containing protein [Acidimicrobiales bacterium]
MTIESESAAEMTFAEAICEAQRDAMAIDESIILLGQDIESGFPFGATRGLAQDFGTDRVMNTPISEAATMGCAVGAAMSGLRPVVEVDFAGFLYLGLDQLLNNAAKIRYMSAGQMRVPLVVRVGQGPLGSFAAQHSQSLHAALAACPGIAVLAPSDAQSAYECMRWALTQGDPVVVCEDLRLYRVKAHVTRSDASGVGARRVRHGEDATVLCYGAGTQIALQAAEQLSEGGISVDVLDLVSLSPLDIEAIADTCRRTGRIVCLADDGLDFGVAPTLATTATTEAWDVLRSPVLQVGARSIPVPYAKALEELVYPSVESVVTAVRACLDWSCD